MTSCRIDGCSKPAGKGKNGYCYMHIGRIRKHGHPGTVGASRLLGATLEEKIHFYGWTESESGCWEWRGPKSHGYGQLYVNGGTVLVHRACYRLWKGPLSADEVVCHACDNPSCINPAHLFSGTQAANIADMLAKGRNSRGETRHNAKLTADDVRQIRNLHRNGVQATVLAERFGVKKRQIWKVVSGQHWKHVTPTERTREIGA